MLIFAVTIASALAFIYSVETANQSNPPPGIVLIAAAGIVSVFTAIITRDILFAPLCCFGGVMSGVILAAIMKDWRYVALEITVPIAFVVSIPAFLIALVLSRRKALSLRLTDS